MDVYQIRYTRADRPDELWLAMVIAHSEKEAVDVLVQALLADEPMLDSPQGDIEVEDISADPPESMPYPEVLPTEPELFTTICLGF